MSRCSYLGTGIPASQSPCGQKDRAVRFGEFTRYALAVTRTRAHTYPITHDLARAHTHTHISGALCLQQHSSSVRDGCPGRCGKNTEQQQLLCGCRHAISPRQARGVVALWRGVGGVWRTELFFMIMKETLRCQCGRRPIEPQQQVNHLCPFPSHTHTPARTLTR